MRTPQCEETTFTREQFYEKVWSAPATKLAVELGLSDVTIGKICKSYGIPKPYPGYWAKLEHGKKPKQTPLPKNDDPGLQTLTFYRYPDRETTTTEPKPEPVYDSDIQQMLDRALAMEPLQVPDSLRNSHPLVAATRDRIKRDQIPFHLQPRNEPRDPRSTLCITVGKDLAPRALRIMDALIKRIEKIGGNVEVRKEKWNEYRTETIVSFGGEVVSVLRLREKQNQVRVPPGKKKDPWDNDTELQPSGLLVLDEGAADSHSILLRDTPKRRRIEDGLNDLIIGFVKQAGEIRIKRRKAEEVRKRQEEEERICRQQEEELRRRREELARCQRAERARVDELIDHANSWRQSLIIRDYLATMCDLLLERDGEVPVEGEVADYLKWASLQADRLDPLRPSPSSVLDERI